MAGPSATAVVSACCGSAAPPDFRGAGHDAISDASVRFLGWMAQGACHDENPELFFPIAAGRADLPRTRAAKAICQGCAVRAQCLSYGWRPGRTASGGGTTMEERSAFRQPADLQWHGSPGPRQIPNLT
jgi:WhiB family transcriptional regulator, redox-sensing transcriptional regulator